MRWIQNSRARLIISGLGLTTALLIISVLHAGRQQSWLIATGLLLHGLAWGLTGLACLGLALHLMVTPFRPTTHHWRQYLPTPQLLVVCLGSAILVGSAVDVLLTR